MAAEPAGDGRPDSGGTGRTFGGHCPDRRQPGARQESAAVSQLGALAGAGARARGGHRGQPPRAVPAWRRRPPGTPAAPRYARRYIPRAPCWGSSVARRQASAVLQHVDFRSSPESARSAINLAISRETHALITESVPRGAVGPGTRLALTNVIYYKGLWSNPFPKRNTRTEPFYPKGAGQPAALVQMMRHTLRAEYLRSSSYEAALLRYRDSALSFGIILPAGPLEYLLSRASSSGVHELLSDAIPCELTIAMPRFRIESSLELADVLARLGIRSAFDPSADFSGISSREPLS
jgi:Serpin (serine protease inhibitor)